MFKGLSGLKKAVKGGFSVVAEHSSQLAEQVVGDPSTSKEHLKESIKKKVSSVVDATETVISAEGTVQAKDKAVEVVHNIKHYGAFGEDYLGYSDPTKDLRKAVKQKEKAAKKAKKANKKLKGKKEDLFDPENLAKYKRDIEQRRLEKEAALASAQEPEEGDKDSIHSSTHSEKDEEKLKFTLDLSLGTPKGPSAVASPLTPAKTPKEETEDWRLFQSLTAGVDSLILQKKSELEELKQESYFQKKQVTERESEEQLKDKKSKKKWIDLDKAGFDDFDGEISGEEAAEDLKSGKEEEAKKELQDEEPKEEGEKNPEGYIDIPEDEPIDLEAEDELFNTAFVEALSEIKLAVIPDDITYDDDPFNTGFADEIVKKDKEEKRREASRIKFTGLSSVADVLTGKADKVDKDLVEVTVKQKRRRANRINLIAEDATEVTARDKIGTLDLDKATEQTDILADLVTSEILVGDLLSSVESSKVSIPVANHSQESKNRLLDLAEFDELPGENQGASLTSNVAILAGEFATAFHEEEDDFDAAFDALAHESVTKSKLDQLEKDFADEDVFDTTAIDGILNLVSLANKVEESVLSPLDTFEDKDPFDTSAYDDIACVLEEELGFESLAKREPKDEDVVIENGPGADVFGGSGGNFDAQSESGWAAFKEDKPARPPPPKPKPEIPRRPPQVQINPSSRPNTPSVVVKAPSTESIKSWNISVAETLIKKSELEALEAEVLAEREEEEFDPFDTTNFASDEAKEESGLAEDIDDPFDTSEVPDFEKEERLKREEEEEARIKAQVDLLTDDQDIGGEIDLAPIIPEKGPDPDPFDTGFAARVLPNKGDPFDTSFVTGCPGKAEIQALEEEFIDKDEFDPRTLEGSSIPRKVVAPGTAGRARPKKGLNTDLVVKVPIETSKPVEQTTSDLEEEEEDPFDTSIVNKVIPVKKTTTRTEVSVEDDDFDPTSNFQKTKKEEIDPFDTTIAVVAVPELAPAVQSVPPILEEVCVEEPKAVPVVEATIQPKVLELDGKTFRILPPAPPRRPSPIKRQISDDEFDPRADAPPEPQNPFLANDVPASAEPANPFLMGSGSGMPMHQPSQNYGVQDMGGNPFASYGSQMYADPSSQYYYQQGAQQSFGQPYQQQQFAGQYGQYNQMPNESFAQPPVQPTFATAPHQPPTSALTGVAAFGIEEPEPAPHFAAEEKATDLPPPPADSSISVLPTGPSFDDDSMALPPPPSVVAETAQHEEASQQPVELTEEALAPVQAEAAESALPLSNDSSEPDEALKKSEDENVETEGSEVKEPPKDVGFGGIFAQSDSGIPPSSEETNKPKSVGASLFGIEDEPIIASSHELDPEPEPELPSKSDSEDEEPAKKMEAVQMSTGEALFADLPAVPDMHSTGATLFGMSDESAKDTTGAMLFGVTAPRAVRPALGAMTGWDENFDKKFDLATKIDVGGLPPGDPYDPFGGPTNTMSSLSAGFCDDGFGSGRFMPPAPQSTPAFQRKVDNDFGQGSMADNPFLAMVAETNAANSSYGDGEPSDDGPLFDDDTSQPLEPFPRVTYDGEGWDMYIRSPPKKKLTAQRFWKKVYVKLVIQADNPCIQLFDTKESKDAFQEVPLQPAYSVSDISHQVFDQYSKIFTMKIQYIFYKERAGIRPGQISKMQKLAGKVGFLAKAVEDADYEGVKEFASDMKKLGVPLEHAPQVSELLKLGSHSFEDLKQFAACVEEKLFRMVALRDRSLTYKTEEIQLTAVDEIFVEQNKSGHIVKHLCRIRVFFLSFLTGMPDVELGVNDIKRMGLEVVGRHDILPIPTEQWIRYEDIEFHSVVDKTEFEKNDHIIKFQPPDACYIEIMRFRIRPPKARELPMQARCIFEITGNKVEIRADMMIPYPHTKAWGQVPCEDVCMRIPLPECWIYQFRTEKHHMSLSQLAAGNLNLSTRMGSVKSAHRRVGKVKGIERFLGALETQTHELMETSSGQAKYEHQHRAIVWRVSRLPKLGQGSYTNHEFVCKLQLTSFDQMPESFEKHFYVEFSQPATCVSNTVLRSVSVGNGSGEPPEKFVKYLARHEYKLEIEFTEKELNTYMAVAKVQKEPSPVASPTGDPDFPDENGKPVDSDSDSD